MIYIYIYIYTYIYIYIHIYVYIYIFVKIDTRKLTLYKQMKHIGNIGNIMFVVTVCVEVSSELSQTFKTGIHAKTVKGFKLSTICARTPF